MRPAMSDKPDRANSHNEDEVSHATVDKRRRVQKEKAIYQGWSIRVDLTVGRGGGASLGGTATGAALTAGESLVRSGSTWPELGAGDGAVRRISGHARPRRSRRNSLIDDWIWIHGTSTLGRWAKKSQAKNLGH